MAQRRALGRVVLCVFDCPAEQDLRGVVEALPASLDDWIGEVVAMDDRLVARADPAAIGRLRGARPFAVRLHQSPREHGYGGARKAAFEYALGSGFEWVVCLRAGVHPVAALARLHERAVAGDVDALFAARFAGETGAGEKRPAWRLFAHRTLNGILNRILGLRLRDHHTSLRAVRTDLLRRVPFQLDAEDRLFDVHLAIQCRALGRIPVEVPVGADWAESARPGEGLRFALRALVTAAGYRLHQLHLIRRGRYFVDEDVHYTLKRADTSSHMQIVAAIVPGALVLDLGCSQGLLARPLAEKGVRVVGVDMRAPGQVSEELHAYHQRDLERPLDLPTGRVFDYVVVSDVIEHLRNREEVLRSARRYLRPGGRLLISTPNIALWFYRLSLLIGRFEYGPRGVLDETHVHLFTQASFRRMVEKAGFHVVAERVTSLPFEVVFESTGRSRLIRAIGHAYHALARVWPGFFAYQHILEAEITTLDEESTVG
jgi:2-polyprenyl-3-methyl-5-hydroxy-6-metoxy-1,4-benzoquinol methylase